MYKLYSLKGQLRGSRCDWSSKWAFWCFLTDGSGINQLLFTILPHEKMLIYIKLLLVEGQHKLCVILLYTQSSFAFISKINFSNLIIYLVSYLTFFEDSSWNFLDITLEKIIPTKFWFRPSNQNYYIFNIYYILHSKFCWTDLL